MLHVRPLVGPSLPPAARPGSFMFYWLARSLPPRNMFIVFSRVEETNPSMEHGGSRHQENNDNLREPSRRCLDQLPISLLSI